MIVVKKQGNCDKLGVNHYNEFCLLHTKIENDEDYEEYSKYHLAR